MPRVLLILAVLALVFYVVSIVDCAVQPPNRHRGVPKSAWLAIIVVLPVLGGILWFVIGRGRRQTAAARRAPDDDPVFLGSIGSISDQDERIRRLEEELAQLDAEGVDPDGPAAEPTDTTAPPAGKADPDSDDPRRGSAG
ncbi:PLD nuclease N-terminal domain-containing protein [Microbacterium sp. NPDC078428]|uniref:PLD nuclease N-terminal domain-containing protein n=1 Tax=Microbacterium limosum TaxID=3079935 RepID=A0AAU0MJ33_9MICO|nr:PLD nuclease N-terminal domain-containing protein [Microbacterium sp. Y20]WOQ70105.1 PLD nuclease N-terminal domain-containing protein [Microbacterium sp. Y20]